MTDFIFKKYPALSDGNFIKFLSSQFLSLTGGYIQSVALSAMISQNEGDRKTLGFFLFCCYIPVFLLSYPASKLLQKIPIKPVLIITDSLLLALSIFLVLFSDMETGMLCIFGAVWGIVRAVQTPACAAVPKLICESKSLSSAVGALSLSTSLARAAGPIISGALYTAFDFRMAFIVNAISFLPSLLLVSLTKIKKEKSFSRKKTKPDISMLLLILVFAVSFCGTSYNVIFTGLCDNLSLSKAWFSVFMAAVGAGAVIGALLSGRGRLPLFSLGIGVLAGALAIFKNGYIIAAITVAYGVLDYLFFTAAQRRINLQNDKESISAAMGVYTAVTTGALPLGYLVMSSILEGLGITWALLFSSVLIASVSLLFFGKIR
ncbi:MAG: MFS transporter [Clostridia bacterium]|nr:MFS transporter [Clostridia bacterium]